MHSLPYELLLAGLDSSASELVEKAHAEVTNN